MPTHQYKERELDLKAASALLEDSSLTAPISDLDSTNPHYQHLVDEAANYARLIRLNSQAPAELRDTRAQLRAARATAAAIAAYVAANSDVQEGAA